MEHELIYKDESFEIIGACMEVHRELGRGYSEQVYKDALEIEFGLREISFLKEQQYPIFYKEVELKRLFFADFIIFEKVVLEVKAVEQLVSSHVKQTLNYLASSGLSLGLLVNFGSESLQFKRIIL